MANLLKTIEFYDNGTYIEKPVTAPVVVPPPPVVVPSGPLIKGGYFDFIPDAQAKAFADQFSMSYVRIWHCVSDWTKPPAMNNGTFVRARALQALGLKTLVVFTTPEKTATAPAGGAPATPDIAQTFFAAAAVAANGAVNAWEIWNEPNLSQYNPTFGYSDWVLNALIPAYAALHKAGQFVVSGGWSGTAGSTFTYMIGKGLLNACDAVGYHPYGSNADDQIAKVTDMRARIGTKPMWLTEWNLHMDKNNPTTWMSELLKASKAVAPMVQAMFHFRMVLSTSAAGVAAPFDAALAKRPTWYDGTVAALAAV